VTVRAAEDLSLALCEQLGAWRYENLPPEIVRSLRHLLIDVLAVLGGAARSPGIPELQARLARWESGGSATALVGRRRHSPPNAALLNGTAAHALDFDDIHDPSRVHSGCIVVPTLLALAEDRGGVSGRAFLTALAVGIEMHARFGMAYVQSLADGWHPTPLFGTLAASLAGAHLLGADAATMRNALGFAVHQTGGSIQSAYDGVMSKRIGAGFAARDAVTSALFALDGLSGIQAALEGPAGFFRLHARGAVDPAALTDRLGSDWRIAQFSFKPYPACRCSHSAIGVAIGLHDEGVRDNAIERIEIGLGEANWKLVGSPYEAARDSVVHAQFNAAYSVARAVIDGRVGPRSYDRPAITEPRVVRLAERTIVSIAPEIPANAIAPVTVRVHLRGGQTIERQASAIKGSPDAPMSEREVIEKLVGCLEYGMNASPAAAQALADVVLGIDATSDVGRAIVEAFPEQ